MYYTEGEVLEHFGDIPKATFNDQPINPRTGKPYRTYTLHWWRWWYGLTNEDKGVLADLEA